MKRVVTVIQARLGSTRLPHKVLADLQGKPLIGHVLKRVRSMSRVYLTAAVPTNDHLLIDALRGLDCDMVLGSEANVLERFGLAARSYQADLIVRVTGDCPLFAPEVADFLVAYMRDNPKVQFASNDTRESGWPDGTDVEVFTRDLLDRALSATDLRDSDREHVTTWMRQRTGNGHVARRPMDEISKVKLSVDTSEDLERVRSILDADPLGFSLGRTFQAAARAGIVEECPNHGR
jgi:spore coat polysaccharide biosynthesis protein SpsF (cytidylyltransferase family)